jgi:hypothetical protein
VYPLKEAITNAVLDLRKDTLALKQLADLEELVDVPPERGGAYLSEWERQFIKSAHGTSCFTPKQREKIAEIWHSVDLGKRSGPDEKAQNIFSKLSPERQAEQRERAKRVKLPWDNE